MLDRQAEICRNNRILLERMSNIMYLEANDPDIHQTKLPHLATNAAHSRERQKRKIESENKVFFI
jgi:hypothetical protein